MYFQTCFFACKLGTQIGKHHGVALTIWLIAMVHVKLVELGPVSEALAVVGIFLVIIILED